MARELNKLSPAFVQNAPAAGKYPDGGGLYFVKTKTSSGQWVYRYSIGGKRHEMGLGGYPAMSLAKARQERNRWAETRAKGIDPIRERDKQRREAARGTQTLAEVTDLAFEARKASLRDEGRAGRWLSPLQIHVLPVLGRTPIDEINQQDIVRAIRPIWQTKPATAKKALNRLGIVLKYGAAMGLPVDLNAKEAAKALLGDQYHKETNVPALHWRDVPEFYQSLTDGTPTQLALRLLILTGSRSKPIRFLHVDHIEGNVWTAPAKLMKGRSGKATDFRYPLSGEALEVISQAKEQSRDGLLFPGVKKGVISDASMSRLMSRRGMIERPHGFRSSLRTWADDVAGVDYAVGETLLAHAVGTAVARSYRRTDHFDKRVAIMERWANHVTGKENQTTNVVSF